MTEPRRLHLGAFMRPVTIHTGAWRYPDAVADANFNLPLLKQLIRRLEAAKFDAYFMADHLAVLNMPVNALKRSHTVTSFEPFTLLSALAMVTERIGLVATASTTFDEPYHIARRFASLDHISDGRAGWNIVTTANPDAASTSAMRAIWTTTHATSARASFTTWSPGYGTASPTMPSCATRTPASTSIPPAFMSSITTAPHSTCAGRSTSPARRRAGR